MEEVGHRVSLQEGGLENMICLVEHTTNSSSDLVCIRSYSVLIYESGDETARIREGVMVVNPPVMSEWVMAAGVEEEFILAIKDPGSFFLELLASLKEVDAEETGDFCDTTMHDLYSSITASVDVFGDFGG